MNDWTDTGSYAYNKLQSENEYLQQQVNHWRNNADCERQRAEDANALLLEAIGLLMQMPIKHPQQGKYREDLVRRIGEHLK